MNWPHLMLWRHSTVWGARKFCGCHMWSLVWRLDTVPQQWPPATQSTWPKLRPHRQVACVYSNSVRVCLSIIPHTQSGVHQGQGQIVFSPLSLLCPQTTGHNYSLSSTTLLSGLPLQVPADNLLKPCCIFFSICLVFHLHWQMQKLCCPRPWGLPQLATSMPYSENSLPLTQFPTSEFNHCVYAS